MEAYERIVRLTVRHAAVTLVIAFGAVVGSIYLGTHLGTEFIPPLDEGEIWIRANLPSGISLEKSAEVAARIRALILQSPEVRLVSSQTGRNDSGTDPFAPNRNEILVTLNPYDTWARGKTKAALVDELSQRVQANIPGVALNFTQPIIDMSTENATGSSADLAVVLSGRDLEDAAGACTARRSRWSTTCGAPRTRRSSRKPTRLSSASASIADRWRGTPSTSATSRT